ncbi:MAG: hypothetical protein E7290_08690 [Lachnospiraceae bacterium]|nr:hypothetical protein [Lachnospiraceae bacterium]
MKNEKRELLPDVLRGFAILLVVLGHCIQEGSGARYSAESLYFYDKLYQWIYSFHMPLFMMVSGYLSWNSVKRAQTKRDRWQLLKRRAVALLAPIFLWTLVDCVRTMIIHAINGMEQPQNLIFWYVNRALNNLWFLWAVFWCFLVVYIVHYYCRDSIVLYVLGFLAMFVIPDGLGLGAYKYMMPFFIVAFYGRGLMEKHGDKMSEKPKLWWILLCGICFGGLFVLFDENSMIYLSGYKLIGKDVLRQLGIDLYRALIGFAGSIFFVMLWKYIVCTLHDAEGNVVLRVLALLGRESMGIYILSGYVLIFGVRRLTFITEPSYSIHLIEMIVITAVALIGSLGLGRIPGLRKMIGK